MLWDDFKSSPLYFIYLCLTNKNIYATEVCHELPPKSIKLEMNEECQRPKMLVLLVREWYETGNMTGLSKSVMAYDL